MRTSELQRRGITFVEGQKNSYDSEFRIHNRSFLCASMKRKLFETKIKPFLAAYGVRYITQTQTLWDLSQFGGRTGEVWISRQNGEGVVRIELLDELVHIDDDQVYVVMWRRRFLPKFIKRAHCLDIDTILFRIMDGRTRPPWFIRLLV